MQTSELLIKSGAAVPTEPQYEDLLMSMDLTQAVASGCHGRPQGELSMHLPVRTVGASFPRAPQVSVAITIVRLLKLLLAQAWPDTRAPELGTCTRDTAHLGPSCAPVPSLARSSLALPDALLLWLVPSRWLPTLPVGRLFSAQLPTDVMSHVIFLVSLWLALGFPLPPKSNPHLPFFLSMLLFRLVFCPTFLSELPRSVASHT